MVVLKWLFWSILFVIVTFIFRKLFLPEIKNQIINIISNLVISQLLVFLLSLIPKKINIYPTKDYLDKSEKVTIHKPFDTINLFDVYYTIDGSDPLSKKGIKYDGAFEINQDDVENGKITITTSMKFIFIPIGEIEKKTYDVNVNKIGDVNLDYKVTALDVAILARKLAEASVLGQEVTTNDYPTADYNGDGVITVRDCSDLAYFLANNIKPKFTDKQSTQLITKSK